MTILGNVTDAWVERGPNGPRVLGHAVLHFDTHSATYRMDLTPGDSENVVPDLISYAKLLPGTEVKIEPKVLQELEKVFP